MTKKDNTNQWGSVFCVPFVEAGYISDDKLNPSRERGGGKGMGEGEEHEERTRGNRETREEEEEEEEEA